MNRAILRMLELAGGGLSRAGARARLAILIYHRVVPAPDPHLKGVIDATAFDEAMSILSASFTVLPLHEALARLASGSLPRRAACVTFDDGYADNADIALPVLERHGIRATFFVAAGYLNGGIMWNDAIIETTRAARGPVLDLGDLGLGACPLATPDDRAASAGGLISALKYLPFGAREERIRRIAGIAGVELPRDLMMDTDRLLRLVNSGMEIGGHTVGHPILARIDDREAEREIRDGKRMLEEYTGRPLRYFAYPNGKPGDDYAARHVAMVREAGFDAALSTARGVATAGSDRFQLPRYTPWERNWLRFTAQLMLNYARDRYPVA